MSALDPDLRKKAERFKRRPCINCNAGVERQYMTRTITASSVNQFRWMCAGCGKNPRITVDNIAHDVIDLWISSGFIPKIDDIEIANNYQAHQCEICDAVGVELHHFAPQSMSDDFGDTWCKWPTIYLCPFHHRLWHELVTPQMSGYNRRHT